MRVNSGSFFHESEGGEVYNHNDNSRIRHFTLHKNKCKKKSNCDKIDRSRSIVDSTRFLCTPDIFWFLYVFSVRYLSFRLAGMKLKQAGLFFFCHNRYFHLFI